MTDYPIIVLPVFFIFPSYNDFDPDKIRYRSIINRLLRLLFYSYHPVFYARSRLSYIDDVYNDMYLLKLMTVYPVARYISSPKFDNNAINKLCCFKLAQQNHIQIFKSSRKTTLTMKFFRTTMLMCYLYLL